MADLYGTKGSVPDVAPAGASGATLGVRASPEAFGAQVGAAKEQYGGAVEKVGAGISELAQKYQGMVYETEGTNAETALIKKYAAGRADFMSSEGQDAVDKQQGYLNMLNEEFENTRSALSPGARRMFDMTGRRLLANYTSEGITYGVSQGKQARDNTLMNNVQAWTDVPKDNPAQLPDSLAAIQHGTTSLLDENTPGVHQDPDTGAFSLLATPEGERTRSLIQTKIDVHTGDAVNNAVMGLADKDPMKASELYDQYKDVLTPAYKASIAAALAPKVEDHHVSSAAGMAISELQHGYIQSFTNPPEQKQKDVADAIFQQESGANPNSPPSVQGAVGKAQIMPATFAQYAKPGEDINNPTDNEAVGRRIVEDLKGKYPNDPARVAVGYFSGPGNVSPPGSSTPWINDTSDKNGKSTSSYVSDVMKRVGGPSEPPSSLPGVPQQNSPKNPDGTNMTTADYMTAHRAEIIQKWREWARQQQPGRTSFENAVAARIDGQINQANSTQEAVYHQTQAKVFQGITGALSQGGKPPANRDELMALPGMKDMINTLATGNLNTQNFYNNIDTMIEKQQKNPESISEDNSPNYYHYAQLALQDKLKTEGELHSAYGRKDETGINRKDYQGIVPVLSFNEDDAEFKKSLSKEMIDIKNAGGNVDGNGEKRAADFFNTAIKAKRQNDTKEDPVSNDTLMDQLKETSGAHKPGIMSQISNWVKSVYGSSSPEGGNAAPASASVVVVSPDGVKGTIPMAQLEEATKAGYKKVE